MYEREAVEHLESCCRCKYFLCEAVFEQGVCRQAEPRAYAFASDFHHVCQRCVQALRLAVEFQVPEHLCDAGLDGAFVYHGFMSCCKLYPANVPMQLTKVAIKS